MVPPETTVRVEDKLTSRRTCVIRVEASVGSLRKYEWRYWDLVWELRLNLAGRDMRADLMSTQTAMKRDRGAACESITVHIPQQASILISHRFIQPFSLPRLFMLHFGAGFSNK